MVNSSFAIWAENDQINIDLHINCWIFEKNDDVIDFGLMISDANQDDRVHFYIPFIAEQEDIQNLTPSVEDSASLKSLIFNEQLKTDDNYEHGANCKFYKRESGEIFSFCLDNYTYQRDFEDGTKLTFKINNNPKEKNTYFRFRLKNIKNERIFKRNTRQVSTITGINEEHINIELNVNQFRKLSTSLQTLIESTKGILNRVNMFLMADINLTPIFSTHSEKPKTRILEDADKWAPYIHIDKEKRYLAFQYKRQDIKIEQDEDGEEKEVRQKFKSFTIFSKFEQVKASPSIMGKAFVSLLLIGILSSSLVSYLFFIQDSPEYIAIEKNYNILSDTNKSIFVLQQKVEDIVDSKITKLESNIKVIQEQDHNYSETFIEIQYQLTNLKEDINKLNIEKIKEPNISARTNSVQKGESEK